MPHLNGAERQGRCTLHDLSVEHQGLQDMKLKVKYDEVIIKLCYSTYKSCYIQVTGLRHCIQVIQLGILRITFKFNYWLKLICQR